MTEEKITFPVSVPISSLQVQRYRSPLGHTFDLGRHKTSFTLMTILRGEVRFYTHGSIITGKAGDFFYIPSGIRYSSVWHGEQGTEHYAIHAIPSEAVGFSADPYALQRIAALSYADGQQQLLSVYHAAEKPEESGTVLSLFFSLYARVLPLLEPKPEHTTPCLLDHALHYIDMHYSQPLSVGDIAEALQVSQSSLYHHFRRELGFTPVQYINQIRLKSFISELSSADPIEEIAYRCGFSSYGYFRQYFKSATGMTPAAYRRMKYGRHHA
ncbi:MAG: helix-turn-helix domain-containing protein [Ruminococcaceae bacterium]|nr:helix-turn-helix domain-containing protein [Oscillospiraceae bacterium]